MKVVRKNVVVGVIIKVTKKQLDANLNLVKRQTPNQFDPMFLCY